MSIAGGQGPDPATVDFPIFYVKRPVPAASAAQPDLRVMRTFQVGADLYMRDRASPTAAETNLTSSILNGQGDVRDVDVSFDGTKVAFAMRGPRIPNAQEKDQPKWAIWEYVLGAAAPHRVIVSDNTAAEGHDVSPHYLPDGRIVFSSTRQTQSGAILLDENKPKFQAQDEDEREPAFVLHVMNGDGTGIHQISFNQSHDRDAAILSSGQIVFARWNDALGRNQFDLYRMNPDGTALQLLYGANSHATGTRNSTIEFVSPRPLPDGKVMVIVRPFAGTDEGGDLLAVDTATYVENSQPTLPNAGMTGPAQVRIPASDVSTIPGPSPGGRYRSAFPLWDGTNRLLVSWSECRVLEAGRIVPCADARLADPNVQSAAPLYGLFIYDVARNTQLPIVSPQEGFIYTDVVAAAARTLPGVILDRKAGVDFDAQLAAEAVGILHIKSVYDFDGQDLAPGGIGAIRNPAITPATQRPARYLRIEKAVSIPDDDTLDAALTAQAFGPDRSLGLREILGYAPVEPDGSVKVKVPANVAFMISVVGADGQRLNTSPLHRSWLQVRPGETVECNGCHDPNRQPPLSHGRDNLFTAANAGATTTGAPFTSTDPALFADMGETMAQTRGRIMCASGACTPSVDVVFDDLWPDAGTPTSPSSDACYSAALTDVRSSVADPTALHLCGSVAASSFLSTAAPTTLHCEQHWNSLCRVVIDYPAHLQPLWEKNLPVNDSMGNPYKCISCHNTKDGANSTQLPAAQLDLTATPSADNPLQLTSYRKLLFTHNEQELSMGVLQDRQVQTGVDPVTGLPQFAPVGVSPPMSAGSARGSRFFTVFAAGGTHAGYLNGAELRLIAEWLDIGAQYYNNPFDVPP